MELNRTGHFGLHTLTADDESLIKKSHNVNFYHDTPLSVSSHTHGSYIYYKFPDARCAQL